MPYVYPKIKGYAIKICDLSHFISPCTRHYFVFCAFWQVHNSIPYFGLYNILKEHLKNVRRYE